MYQCGCGSIRRIKLPAVVGFDAIGRIKPLIVVGCEPMRRIELPAVVGCEAIGIITSNSARL